MKKTTKIGEKKTIYTLPEMYGLGEGDMTECTFDFSKISIDHYEGFFNTLPQILYKKVRTVTFCNDLQAKLQNEPNSVNTTTENEENKINENEEEELKMYGLALKNHKPGYSSYLAKILGQVLPKTKLLHSLTIDRIPLSHESFKQIATGLSKTNKVKEIAFTNTNVDDEDLKYFLSVVSPFKIEKITLFNTKISSDSYKDIAAFLNQQPPSNKKNDWKVALINLDEREFDPKDNGSNNPKNNVKTRNIELNEQSLGDATGNSDEEELSKSRAELALEEIRRAASTVKPASPSNDIRRQNQNLKRELDELLFKVKAVKYNDDVFLIGDTAQDSLDSIRAAETQIRLYEAEHGEIAIE